MIARGRVFRHKDICITGAGQGPATKIHRAIEIPRNDDVVVGIGTDRVGGLNSAATHGQDPARVVVGHRHRVRGRDLGVASGIDHPGMKNRLTVTLL